MIYLDTGCLLKLYYPEPESKRVAELVEDTPIAFSKLHELELSNALELKLYRKEATAEQVREIHRLVAADIESGVLYRPSLDTDQILDTATSIGKAHTRKLGCRSLDILHCAAAAILPVNGFVTTDKRQRRLAVKLGLPCPSV